MTAARSRFRAQRRIEFADTDMGGIVHFSRFFVFMETAEHAFLAALGAPVHAIVDGREIAWPRVAASCEYQAPARFGDEIEIEVEVQRLGRTSITWGFRFHCGGDQLAVGRLTAVCCALGQGGLEPIPLPPALAASLAAAEPVTEPPAG